MKVFKTGLFVTEFMNQNERLQNSVKICFNSQGTEFFPFSYFENPWLECDLVIKDLKNINNYHKTRTDGLNIGREGFHRGHHMTP